MAVLANTVRDPKRQPKPFTPADFIPKWDTPPAMPWQQMLANAQQWTRALNGR